jgi:N utilization substance protein B
MYGKIIVGDNMKNRSELREIAMKVLYQIDILEDAKQPIDKESLIKEQLEIENDFVNELVDGVLANKKAIKKLANDHLSGWTIDRLSKVDKAILEIGIFELMYTKTPSVVSINEAIELSKQYSDEKVTKMINACLDKIYHENEGKIDEQ